MFMKDWNEVTTWYAPDYPVGFHYKLPRVKIL